MLYFSVSVTFAYTMVMITFAVQLIFHRPHLVPCSSMDHCFVQVMGYSHLYGAYATMITRMASQVREAGLQASHIPQSSEHPLGLSCHECL